MYNIQVHVPYEKQQYIKKKNHNNKNNKKTKKKNQQTTTTTTTTTTTNENKSTTKQLVTSLLRQFTGCIHCNSAALCVSGYTVTVRHFVYRVTL